MNDREILDRLWEAHRETPFASFTLERKLNLTKSEYRDVLNLLGDMADSGETQNGYRIKRVASTVYKMTQAQQGDGDSLKGLPLIDPKESLTGQSERRTNMKEQHTSVKYTLSEIDTLPDETDWERVDALTDEDIDAAASSDPDAPPTDASFWKDATVVMPENKVGKEQPMPQINIDSDLLVAQRLPDDSVSWTLASRLGDMLDMAENLFGERDYCYTILGIQFTSDNPKIWYHGKHRKHIIIQLGPCAATNMSQACYQMAHETIHLLAPSCGRNANNFEEGVACYFAAYYMKEQFNEPCWSPGIPSYERTLAVIKPRLDEDIYCIRRLREHHPSFQDITKEEISREFPKLASENVDFLMSTFDRDSSKC